MQKKALSIPVCGYFSLWIIWGPNNFAGVHYQTSRSSLFQMPVYTAHLKIGPRNKKKVLTWALVLCESPCLSLEGEQGLNLIRIAVQESCAPKSQYMKKLHDDN